MMFIFPSVGITSMKKYKMFRLLFFTGLLTKKDIKKCINNEKFINVNINIYFTYKNYIYVTNSIN